MAILIFDYDGTLHDSMHIYGPAVRKCHEGLAAAALVPRRSISDEEIHSYLGLSIEEMWLLFAPELSPEKRAEGGQIIGSLLRESVQKGKALLYEGALNMLEELKKEGHKLVYLSNCTKSYKELHQKAFKLDQYFDEMYCSEEFAWKEKCEIAEILLEKWTLAYEANAHQKEANDKCCQVIAIGDRRKDINIGEVRTKTGKIKTIWCSYGFGKPEEGVSADAAAGSVFDIPGCVHKLLEERM